MDRPGFQAWLDAYVAAWKSYDPEAIGALFAPDAAYRFHPEDEPLRGREAIIASWLDQPDAPGSWDARYEPLAIDGDVHVASGWTRYFTPVDEIRDEYWNVYDCRFDADGRCTSFTEWWMRGRRRAQAAGQTEAA